MHKTRAPTNPFPLCPIVPSIGTYDCELTEVYKFFMESPIQPHIPMDYSVMATLL